MSRRVDELTLVLEEADALVAHLANQLDWLGDNAHLHDALYPLELVARHVRDKHAQIFKLAEAWHQGTHRRNSVQ